MLERLLGEDVELVDAARRAESARVEADRGQIEQVMMNLVVNARDAMPRGGKLTIETANVELDERATRRATLGVDAGPVRDARRDATPAVGMDEATLARIFEPFFTTKEQGKGTGLGLSTVFGIVQAERRRTSGSTASRAGDDASRSTSRARRRRATPSSTQPARAAARGDRDDPARRGRRAGPRRDRARSSTESATTSSRPQNGGEALLRSASSTRGAIHLLLTDVVMPRMSGRQLAERLAACGPR